MLDYNPQPMRLNKEEIRKALHDRLKDVLFHLFLDGKIVGNEFQIGDVHGKKGKSLNVCLSGPKMGCWNDFASEQDKGDIFSLWGFAHGLDPQYDFGQILEQTAAWLGMSHVQNIPQAEPQLPNKVKKALSQKTWTYRTADGEPYVRMKRRDLADNKKEFQPYNFITNEYKMPDPRPLYNLPGIVSSGTVIFVEGEKCAEVLIRAGYQATTAMGGSKTKAEKTDFCPLKGKTVIFWPDNDGPGEAYLKNIVPALQAAGAGEVRVLTPPIGKPEKWDAADAVEEGFDIDAYLKTAGRHICETMASELRVFSLEELLNDKTPTPQDLIGPRILTPGGITVVGGAPKVGKSNFLLSMFAYLAAGVSFLDFKAARPLRIFYLQAEVEKPYLIERLKRLELPGELIKKALGNLHISEQFKMSLDERGVETVIKAVDRVFPERNADITVIDPIRNVFDAGEEYKGLGENDNNAMLFFLQQRVEVIREAVNPDAGVILVHHTKKISKHQLKEDPFLSFSGASSLRSYYSTGIIIQKPDEDSTVRKLFFELRNGPEILDMLIDNPEGHWIELDPDTTPLVRAEYANKNKAERSRQHDKIIQIIRDEAREHKRLYTVEKFSNKFEDVYGLGSSNSIKQRIAVLMDKQVIRLNKGAHPLTGETPGRSKYGTMIVENMRLGEDKADPDTGEIIEEAVPVLPTHYKDAESKKPWKLDNPEDWSPIEREPVKTESLKPPPKKRKSRKKR